MIESIEFTNFKALRKTTLLLAPFTLLLGPNGSGKSSVLQAIRGVAALAASRSGIQRQNAGQNGFSRTQLLSVTAKDQNAPVEIKLSLRLNRQLIVVTFQWSNNQVQHQLKSVNGIPLPQSDLTEVLQWLGRMQTYSLDASAIVQPVSVSSGPLHPNGTGLAAVLDDLKDNHPEKWEILLAEMRRWLPEYDHILFDKPRQGSKGVVLRTKKGGGKLVSVHYSRRKMN